MQQCNKSIEPCSGRKLCQQALTDKWKSRSGSRHWKEFQPFLAFTKNVWVCLDQEPNVIWIDQYVIIHTHTHRCWMYSKQHIQSTQQQSLKNSFIFKSKFIFFSTNRSWWLLILVYLCAQVWIVLAAPDWVLCRYLMCKCLNLFVAAWKHGCVFGLLSL